LAGSKAIMNDREQQEELIFEKAAQIASDAEREVYLEQACEGDAALRTRLELLLEGHFKGQGFLDPQPARVAGNAGPPALGMPQEEVGTIIGRYKLMEKVGEGGFGAVYVAEQREPVKRRVALKIIKLGMDTKQVIARFEAERQALALMDHPNIASVLEAGATETGRPYFVMELVRGSRITDYCDENNLSTEQRLDLFTQVCHAIQHAHQKSIIHRDIKPSNILVTVVDGRPMPKVIDFGIAKATHGQLTDQTVYTQFHQFIGTPAYMSPEQTQLSGVDVDTRSDIYSLGVLLYELLTAHTPFDPKTLLAAGLDEMRRLIREREPPWPSTRISTLDEAERTTVAKHRQAQPAALSRLVRGDLDWIVMKCLEKERARRYETANALAQDIEHHLKQEPVTAAAPGAVYRAGKFVRRHKVGLATATGLVLLLVAGVVVSTWQAVRATRAERFAVQERQQTRAEAERADRNAAAESRQRAIAEQAAHQAKQALASALTVEAERLVQENQSDKALACFARAVRLDSSNRVAACRIISMLNQRDFPLPLETGSNLVPALEVAALARSGDWRCYCVQTNDSYVLVEVPSGKVVGTPLPLSAPCLHPPGHQGPPEENVTFLLSESGLRMALSGTGWSLVWDFEVGRKLLNLEASATALSPNGKMILAGDRVLDVDTGMELFSLKDKREAQASAAFSPDSSKLAFGTKSNTTALVSTRSGERLMPDILGTPSHMSLFLHFTPDGRYLVLVADRGDAAEVWDLASHRIRLRTPPGDGSIWSLALSRDGRVLGAGFSSGEARLWSLSTGLPVRETCPGNDSIQDVTCSFDGAGLAVFHTPEKRWDWRRPMSRASLQKKLWDIRPGRSLPITLYHPASLRHASFSRNGTLVETLGWDGAVRVWRAEDGAFLFSPNTEKGVECSAFSPDSSLLVTREERGGAVRLWEATSGRRVTTIGSDGAQLTALIFSPDGRRLAAGAADGSIHIWEMPSGKVLASKPADQCRILNLSINPTSERLVVCRESARTQVLDLATLEKVIELWNWWDMGAEFSHGDEWLCTYGNKNALLWAASTGDGPKTVFPSALRVNTACFSSDDRLLLVALADGNARIWEATSGRLLTVPLAHQGNVLMASFSPDDRSVITASADGTAVVWDVRTGRRISEPFRHGGGVAVACFSSDGRRILTAGSDRSAAIHEWIEAADTPPPWLPDLAEATSGYRLTQDGVAELLPDAASGLAGLRERLGNADTTNSLATWGRWYLADRHARPISSQARIMARDYAEKLAQETEVSALELALDLGSRNPVIYGRLASMVESSQPETALLYRRLAGSLGGVQLAAGDSGSQVSGAPQLRTANDGAREFLDPLAREDLLERAGHMVRVKGRVVRFGQARSGTWYYLWFAENYRASLRLSFHIADNPAEFRPEVLQAYVNKTIVVEGQMGVFNGNPDMNLKSVAQIKVLEDAPPPK
jgi:eukaryotic-like serine/threonine-protein kinase